MSFNPHKDKLIPWIEKFESLNCEMVALDPHWNETRQCQAFCLHMKRAFVGFSALAAQLPKPITYSALKGIFFSLDRENEERNKLMGSERSVRFSKSNKYLSNSLTDSTGNQERENLCFYCKEPGHRIRDCEKRKKSKKPKKSGDRHSKDRKYKKNRHHKKFAKKVKKSKARRARRYLSSSDSLSDSNKSSSSSSSLSSSDLYKRKAKVAKRGEIYANQVRSNPLLVPFLGDSGARALTRKSSQRSINSKIRALFLVQTLTKTLV